MTGAYTLVLLGLLTVGGEGGGSSPPTEAASGPAAEVGEKCRSSEIADTPNLVADLPKRVDPPPSGSGVGPYLDFGHDWLYVGLQRMVDHVDGWFVPAGGAKIPVLQSHFRLDLEEALWEDGEKKASETTTRFDVDLHIPNAERWLRGFVTTTRLDELTGFGDRGGSFALRAGLRGTFFDQLDADFGLHVSLSPEIFASLRLAPRWRFGEWQVRPSLKGYWTSDEGLGSTASVAVDRWFGPLVVRSATGAKLSDETNGIEWQESLLVAWAPETIAERRGGALAAGLDIARGWGIRAAVDGKTGDPGGVDTVEVGLFTRFPLRKGWLFGFVEPAVRWRQATDREREFGIRVGIVSLFWGLAGD